MARYWISNLTHDGYHVIGEWDEAFSSCGGRFHDCPDPGLRAQMDTYFEEILHWYHWWKDNFGLYGEKPVEPDVLNSPKW